MESFSDLDDEGSGLELVHVSDVLDYLGEYSFPTVNGSGCESVGKGKRAKYIRFNKYFPL